MTTARIELPPKLIPVFQGEARYRAAHGGRGSGKTRAGSELTHRVVEKVPRIALIGPTSADVRDIMLEAVERRFGTCRAPSVIEMLSDKGSPYIAKETQISARQLGLKPCLTPVQSPQSNGLSLAMSSDQWWTMARPS